MWIRDMPVQGGETLPVWSGSQARSQGQWTLVHAILEPVWSAWFSPQTDLFDTQLSHRLSSYVSPVPDQVAWAVDALSSP